jgi:Domain of unknown function (DUF4391)
MNTDALLAALDLPTTARIDQRVPKKMLWEHGAPTTADKRLIQDGIDELVWVAALKPTTIGVPAFRDTDREYLEIIVLCASMRSTAKINRLVTLVHRAVPYPLLLLTEQTGQTGLSVAHKRWSQAHAGKTVLEGDVVAVDVDARRDNAHWPTFRDALALGKQPCASLHALYQGWLDTLHALHAARVTGAFAVVTDPKRAAERRAALEETARLVAVMKRLLSRAGREKQMARRVELNLEIQRIEAALRVNKERL